MSPFLVFFFILLLNLVKSDETSHIPQSGTKNNTMTVTEHCRNNCIVKCCPVGQLLAPTQNGTKCVEPKNKLIKQLINYNNIMVYRLGASSDLVSTNNSLQSHFTFTRNDIFNKVNASVTLSWCDIYILEDGSLKTKTKESCLDMAPLKYCIEYHYMKKDNKPGVVFTYRALIDNDPDAKMKHSFIAAGLLVSSLFMVLVLAVYCALPRLRNIVGMILMAYMLSLTLAFMMKAAQLIALNFGLLDTIGCRNMSPAVLYFTIASFFWLNIMSFDLWWTIRGSRKRRDIHRQGELVKFLWYALYGWGTPALLTAFFVAINKYHLYRSDNYKPPFDSCFAETTPTAIYMHVPIGVMTAANCVLFVMTAYNVWLVKRAIHNVKDANNTKNSENRFVIYIKLSVLMGVSWIFELIPDMSLVPYIFVNFYNVFIGVAIFLMFVCKKDIIAKLCKRFNISNRFVDKLQVSRYSKTESSKTTSRKDSKYQRNEEATELTMYTTNDTTDVEH